MANATRKSEALAIGRPQHHFDPPLVIYTQVCQSACRQLFAFLPSRDSFNHSGFLSQNDSRFHAKSRRFLLKITAGFKSTVDFLLKITVGFRTTAGFLLKITSGFQKLLWVYCNRLSGFGVNNMQNQCQSPALLRGNTMSPKGKCMRFSVNLQRPKCENTLVPTVSSHCRRP